MYVFFFLTFSDLLNQSIIKNCGQQKPQHNIEKHWNKMGVLLHVSNPPVIVHK